MHSACAKSAATDKNNGPLLLNFAEWSQGVRRLDRKTRRGLENAPPVPVRSRASQIWAMLIKRVYEIDPLACSRCSGQMKIVAFVEPPQGDVIEKILRHCGLWCPASPRAPPAGDLRVHDQDGDWESDSASQEPQELTFVDGATFWATF